MTEFFNFSSENGTDVKPSLTTAPVIKIIHDVIIITLLVLIMFAMGCLITIHELWTHIRRPVGVVIGMVSQFVVLPLIAFCLIKIFGVNPLQGTGILILASSPGGVTSNVFTYFSDGDVPLSVSMTTCSTVLALAMMPANIWIYGQHLENQGSIVIPYSKIGISVISVTAPVAFGMLVKWKLPKIAHYLSKVGAYSGFALIILSQVLELLIYPDIFSTIKWDLYATLFILPGASLILGYGLAFVCRQTPKVRRTIAMECSLQNIGISLTVIAMSFPYHVQKSVIAFSYLYPVPMVLTATIAILIYRVHGKYFVKTDAKVSTEYQQGHLMMDIKS